MIFENKQKNHNFIIMATLTRYNSFKSLKQSSSVKVKKTAIHVKKVEAEVEAFLQLLSKPKAKKA